MISLLGIALIALAAFALSTKRGLIDKRTVLGAFLLQAGLGGIVLYIPLGKDLLDFLAQKVIARPLSFKRVGVGVDIDQREVGDDLRCHAAVIGFFTTVRMHRLGSHHGQQQQKPHVLLIEQPRALGDRISVTRSLLGTMR